MATHLEERPKTSRVQTKWNTLKCVCFFLLDFELNAEGGTKCLCWQKQFAVN